MKTEKAPKEKSAREIELEHEKDPDWAELDDESKVTIIELRGLLKQGVVKLDFKEDPYGTVESVTVRKVVDNSVVFYSEVPRDIKEIVDFQTLELE